MKPFLLLCCMVLSIPVCLWAEPMAPQPVWSGPPPSETLQPKPGQDPRGIVKNGGRTDVFIPEFVAWPAPNPGAPIVIVCPGGGYGGLAEEHEGAEVARRLNAFGSAAVVLRYRVPRRSQTTPWVVPVLDAREMLRIVRKRAAEWNADPFKVGILGFSAGGNLAARVAYSPAEPDAPRPDFAALIYPAYLFEEDRPGSVLREGPDGVVPASNTQPLPPAFFAHSADDKYPAEASMALAARLRALGGSAEVHIWAKGGHGWGATDRCEAAKRWTDLLGIWMRETGFLSGPANP